MIQIPAFLVFACIVAVLGLIGSLITAVYSLGKRVTALEGFLKDTAKGAARESLRQRMLRELE